MNYSEWRANFSWETFGFDEMENSEDFEKAAAEAAAEGTYASLLDSGLRLTKEQEENGEKLIRIVNDIRKSRFNKLNDGRSAGAETKLFKEATPKQLVGLMKHQDPRVVSIGCEMLHKTLGLLNTDTKKYEFVKEVRERTADSNMAPDQLIKYLRKEGVHERLYNFLDRDRVDPLTGVKGGGFLDSAPELPLNALRACFLFGFHKKEEGYAPPPSALCLALSESHGGTQAHVTEPNPNPNPSHKP